MKKVSKNQITILNDTVLKMGCSNYLIDDIVSSYKILSRDEFIIKYNLSCRGFDHLYKILQLKNLKPKSNSIDLFISSLESIEKFERDYKSNNMATLEILYNAKMSTIINAAKKLNIKLTKDETLNRVKLTNLERYGSEWYSSTEDWKNNTQKTKLLKYGNANYNNAEKAKQTCLERYGETNANKCKETRDKIKRTNLERYGAENYRASDDFFAKSAKTKLERYGNATYNNRQKAEETCLKKYGVKNHNQSEIVKSKRKDTNLVKYGAENVFSNQEIKNKIKSTVENKYGVPYACMTEQCRTAATLGNSSANINFMHLLDDNNIEYTREFPIDSYSYDFKVNNFLVEVNPTATHNSTWGWRGNKDRGLDKYYHQNKSAIASENGYQCLCVWDWDSLDKIIKLIKPRDTIYARKCEIREVSSADSEEFLNDYHLQNYVPAEIQIGLYYSNTLVSLMTFGKPRYNKKYQYELLRYCSSYNVIGGAEKMFKYFLLTYRPDSIISYCDASKFSGKVYETLGFSKLSNKVEPSKHWAHPFYKKHITDNLLRQRGFDQLFDTSFGKNIKNTDLMLEAGFVEVYDCGQITYVYSRGSGEEC